LKSFGPNSLKNHLGIHEHGKIIFFDYLIFQVWYLPGFCRSRCFFLKKNNTSADFLRLPQFQENYRLLRKVKRISKRLNRVKQFNLILKYQKKTKKYYFFPIYNQINLMSNNIQELYWSPGLRAD